MSRFCPMIKEKVLYTVCLECDDREECMNGIIEKRKNVEDSEDDCVRYDPQKRRQKLEKAKDRQRNFRTSRR